MAFGPTEWLIVFGAILLLFGAAAIPKLARSLGRAKGEFQKAKSDFDRELAAGQAEAGKAAGATEEQIRRTAREMGVEEEGKPLDEVKKALNERLG